MIDSLATYNRIGQVKYSSSSKAKSVNITVKPFEPVKVSVPKSISLEEAKTVVKNNMNWIIREVEKMELVEQQFTVFKPDSTYSFKDVTIKFIKSDVERITEVSVSNNKVAFHVYNTPRLSDEHQKYIIDNIIIPKMREWCIDNIIPRALALANKHKINIPSVTIRTSRTRWGSLGKNHGLNLSLFLATLPDDLIDYVILHELAHTKYKDHSKLYWGYLKSLCDTYKSLSDKLKQFKIGII